MMNASYNCFVSHALCSESDKLLKYVRKEILYNGVSDSFKKLSDSDRIILREKYGVLPEEKLIAFVGNLINVKNVMSLRPIFHEVRAKYQGKLKFWLVGDGKLRSAVQQAMDADDTIDVFFWGNVPAEQMPDIMNCIDVLTLPSINEGLALVCAEAIRCGAAVVGSSVGGIPEVIGHEYSVPLDEGFVGNISDKIVEILLKGAKQNIPEHMDWKITAGAEMKLIESVLSGMC
jgi:glycosyltransferase involved in cell wall biosynthesis